MQTAIFAVSAETGSVSYELEINNVLITETNKDDVLSDGGSVKYNPDTRCLLLTDADIQYIGSMDYGGYTFFSGDLEINLAGNSSIESKDYFAIELPIYSSNLIITGSGSLRVETQSSNHCAIFCKSLTIKDTQVEINTPNYYTIGGDYGNSIAFTADHSHIRLTAGKEGAVQLHRFEMLNSEITSPRGAEWDSHSMAFVDFNSPIAAGTTIEIQPVGSGLEDIMSAGFPNGHARKVYDPETGNIYILLGGKAYNLQGRVVK